MHPLQDAAFHKIDDRVENTQILVANESVKLRDAMNMLDGILPDGRILIISDAAIETDELERALASAHREYRLVALPEPAKSAAELIQCWDHFSQTAPTAAIAVGGGTLLDLVGLAASTYQRGTPRINVPTTLLAMVDATIGGKTGIDYGGVKNSVGTLSSPIASLCVPRMLRTVPGAIRWAGYSELLKIAALYDYDYYESLDIAARCQRYPSAADICRAIRAKLSITSNPSAKKFGLLFGHNLAHALETMIPLNHGLAVAVGIAGESALGVVAGVTDPEVVYRIVRSLKYVGLPTVVPAQITTEALANAVAKYKLTVEGVTRFVLPSGIGERYAGSEGYFAVSTLELPELLTKCRLLLDSERNAGPSGGSDES